MRKQNSSCVLKKKRVKFLQENFPNVQPISIDLPSGKYEYVPIGETLKLLMEDDSYIKQKADDPYTYEEGIYKDTRDGELFRENAFFKLNPDAIGLLLFQDELEVFLYRGIFIYMKNKIMNVRFAIHLVQLKLNIK